MQMMRISILVSLTLVHYVSAGWRNKIEKQILLIEQKLEKLAVYMATGKSLFESEIASIRNECGCTGAPACPEGWWRYLNTCYFWVDNKQNWYEAETYCNSLGGQLAIPINEAQDHLLSNLTASYNLPAWLGASDELQEGFWISVADGRPLEYTNWMMSDFQEPNGGSGENCLDFKMVGGHAFWNDAPCTLILNSLCEKTP